MSAQENAPQFDTVVVHDPHIDGIPDVAARFPGIRVVVNFVPGQGHLVRGGRLGPGGSGPTERYA